MNNKSLFLQAIAEAITIENLCHNKCSVLETRTQFKAIKGGNPRTIRKAFSTQFSNLLSDGIIGLSASKNIIIYPFIDKEEQKEQ